MSLSHLQLRKEFLEENVVVGRWSSPALSQGKRPDFVAKLLVEPRGLEPLIPCLQSP